jgi:hypothetical protein
LDEGLGHFHGLKDDSAGWEAYLEKLKATLILDDRYMTDEELIGLVRKSRKGSLREAKSKMRSVDRSPEDFRTERMATWGAVLDQALVDEGLVGVDFAAKTKSDDSKVRVAVRVLKHCPATSAWLAGRLSMGTAGNLRRLLAAARKSEA